MENIPTLLGNIISDVDLFRWVGRLTKREVKPVYIHHDDALLLKELKELGNMYAYILVVCTNNNFARVLDMVSIYM